MIHFHIFIFTQIDIKNPFLTKPAIYWTLWLSGDLKWTGFLFDSYGSVTWGDFEQDPIPLND